jgi:hypothetical protein
VGTSVLFVLCEDGWYAEHSVYWVVSSLQVFGLLSPLGEFYIVLTVFNYDESMSLLRDNINEEFTVVACDLPCSLLFLRPLLWWWWLFPDFILCFLLWAPFCECFYRFEVVSKPECSYIIVFIIASSSSEQQASLSAIIVSYLANTNPFIPLAIIDVILLGFFEKDLLLFIYTLPFLGVSRSFSVMRFTNLSFFPC